MGEDVTLLSFDETYQKQRFYERESYQMLNLESIANTNLFCEPHALQKIAQLIKKRRPSKLTFIGSGNYHYVSYLLLSEMEHPFTLILFDNHTDTVLSPSDTLISCGSWVLESLHNLPMLKKVIIIGVSEQGLQHIPPALSDKITTITKESLQTNFSKALTTLKHMIPTDSVYISIDKDVLDVQDAITGWDHGNMRLVEVLDMMRSVFTNKKVSGIDICGEYPINPTNAYKPETKEAVHKNNEANRILLESIKLGLGAYSHSAHQLQIV